MLKMIMLYCFYSNIICYECPQSIRIFRHYTQKDINLSNILYNFKPSTNSVLLHCFHTIIEPHIYSQCQGTNYKTILLEQYSIISNKVKIHNVFNLTRLFNGWIFKIPIYTNYTSHWRLSIYTTLPKNCIFNVTVSISLRFINYEGLSMPSFLPLIDNVSPSILKNKQPITLTLKSPFNPLEYYKLRQNTYRLFFIPNVLQCNYMIITKYGKHLNLVRQYDSLGSHYLVFSTHTGFDAGLYKVCIPFLAYNFFQYLGLITIVGGNPLYVDIKLIPVNNSKFNTTYTFYGYHLNKTKDHAFITNNYEYSCNDPKLNIIATSINFNKFKSFLNGRTSITWKVNIPFINHLTICYKWNNFSYARVLPAYDFTFKVLKLITKHYVYSNYSKQCMLNINQHFSYCMYNKYQCKSTINSSLHYICENCSMCNIPINITLSRNTISTFNKSIFHVNRPDLNLQYKKRMLSHFIIAMACIVLLFVILISICLHYKFKKRIRAKYNIRVNGCCNESTKKIPGNEYIDKHIVDVEINKD